MRALTRKLWRDLWHMKGPALAIMMVVAAGVAVFVASMSASDSLELSRTTYYNEYRFAHVFASLRRAPTKNEKPRPAERPGRGWFHLPFTVQAHREVRQKGVGLVGTTAGAGSTTSTGSVASDCVGTASAFQRSTSSANTEASSDSTTFVSVAVGISGSTRCRLTFAFS